MKISLRVFLYEGSSSLKLILDQIWKWEEKSASKKIVFYIFFAHFQRIFRTLYSYNLADKYLFKLNSENAGTTTLFIVEFGQVFTQRETEIHLIIVFIYSFFFHQAMDIGERIVFIYSFFSPRNGYRRVYSLHLFFFFSPSNGYRRAYSLHLFFFTKQWISESL